MEKYKVTMAFERQDGHVYERVYADSPEQAEKIALQMFEEDRRDFFELSNVRACAQKPVSPKPIDFKNLMHN